mmetsp:Transcript_41158/g.83023  ORF Transcript_41158/g.83023 Transcript_41158/m.83023 type:complete len:205 (-) Transcript_41158:28-642(-)
MHSQETCRGVTQSWATAPPSDLQCWSRPLSTRFRALCSPALSCYREQSIDKKPSCRFVFVDFKFKSAHSLFRTAHEIKTTRTRLTDDQTIPGAVDGFFEGVGRRVHARTSHLCRQVVNASAVRGWAHHSVFCIFFFGVAGRSRRRRRRRRLCPTPGRRLFVRVARPRDRKGVAGEPPRSASKRPSGGSATRPEDRRGGGSKDVA